MSLTSFLTWLGYPIAYYPRLATLLGGVNPAVFVCQLLYWQTSPRKAGDPAPSRDEAATREIYKTATDIERETGLSEEEQRTARKKLTARKVLRERYDRLHHRMYYSVDFDALDALAAAGNFPNPGMPGSGSRESQAREAGKTALVNTKTTSQITSETTTRRGRRGGGAENLSSNLPWPRGVGEAERNRCMQVMRDYPHDLQLQFIAALQETMASGRLKKAAHRYLAGCVQKYRDGKFTPQLVARQETEVERAARLKHEKLDALAREARTHESAASMFDRAGDKTMADRSRQAAQIAREQIRVAASPSVAE